MAKLTKADKRRIKDMIKIAKWIWPNDCTNIKVSDFTNKMLNDTLKRFAEAAVKSQPLTFVKKIN